jgi:hypothetical protein
MWLFLHPEEYFQKGKEDYAKQEAINDAAVAQSSSSSSSSGGGKTQQKSKPALPAVKFSSKQVGDELTNGPKPDNHTAANKKKAKKTDSDRLQLQSAAEDAARMWPLTCYELSISVDQEEKFLQALKRSVLSTVGGTKE